MAEQQQAFDLSAQAQQAYGGYPGAGGNVYGQLYGGGEQPVGQTPQQQAPETQQQTAPQGLPQGFGGQVGGFPQLPGFPGNQVPTQHLQGLTALPGFAPTVIPPGYTGRGALQPGVLPAGGFLPPRGLSPRKSPGKVLGMRRVWPPTENQTQDQQMIQNLWTQVDQGGYPEGAQAQNEQQQGGEQQVQGGAPQLGFPPMGVPPFGLPPHILAAIQQQQFLAQRQAGQQGGQQQQGGDAGQQQQGGQQGGQQQQQQQGVPQLPPGFGGFPGFGGPLSPFGARRFGANPFAPPFIGGVGARFPGAVLGGPRSPLRRGLGGLGGFGGPLRGSLAFPGFRQAGFGGASIGGFPGLVGSYNPMIGSLGGIYGSYPGQPFGGAGLQQQGGQQQQGQQGAGQTGQHQ